MNKTLAHFAAVAVAGLCATGAMANSVLMFTPSTQHAEIGDTVTVDVTLSNLGAQVLSGFDLNFLYNGAVMGSTFRGIDPSSAQAALVAGSASPTPALVWAIDTDIPGNWGLQASSVVPDADLAAAQPDAFLLATFSFRAEADGVTTFTLGLDPDFERNFLGLNAEALAVDIGSACVAVGTGSCNTVPEPTSALLATLALAGAAAPAGLRRRRRAD